MVLHRGLRLADLTWPEAEKLLTPASIVVLPLGAGAKEHGLHLRLDNDQRLAEGLAALLLRDVTLPVPWCVAPTLTYHHYPAFAEYPGSASLRKDTARDLVVDVATSLAAQGPQRFYVLNTGVSTVEALRPAAEALASQNVVLRFTDWSAALEAASRGVAEQERGSHADEVETSLMLALAPDRVDLAKARKDAGPAGKGGLSRSPGGPKTHSPTGAWGDPTLASTAKGTRLLDALLGTLQADLARLAAEPVPR